MFNKLLEKLSTVVWLFITLVIGYGWVMNIVILVKGQDSVGMNIAHVVGIIIFPLGAVLGLFF